jgi:hypothetical protein
MYGAKIWKNMMLEDVGGGLFKKLPALDVISWNAMLL